MANELPDDERSPDIPILQLQAQIGAALANIAPEKAAELLSFVKDRGVQFLLDDGFNAHADTEKPAIVLGSVLLERLWARAYAYYVFYSEMSAEKSANPGATEFDPNANQRRAEAGELLRWALEGELAKPQRKLKWIDRLPCPRADPIPGSDVHCANEVFLCATAFLQHHELSHLRLGHWGRQQSASEPSALNPDSVDQERDADNAAADWILDSVPADDPRFEKRALGVVVALLAVVSTQVYKKSTSSSHPQPFNRLYHVIDRWIDDPNHLAWAVAASVLLLHLVHDGTTPDPGKMFETWKDYTNELIDLLSRIVDGENGELSD